MKLFVYVIQKIRLDIYW